MQSRVHDLGLSDRVQFVGRLDATQQAEAYARARWYLSLPRSDSVSVSVLEAMAHGCIPILSDLPANRELVTHGDNGFIVPAGAEITAQDLAALRERADAVGERNRAWVAAHAIFPQAVDQFVQRLVQLQKGRTAGKKSLSPPSVAS
jgi:glycosyltransferase involved in cell wall biosynthesis